MKKFTVEFNGDIHLIAKMNTGAYNSWYFYSEKYIEDKHLLLNKTEK